MRMLVEELARRHPGLDDPESIIRSGSVHVDGAVFTNPRSRVRADAAIVIRDAAELRGAVKLRQALEAFDVRVPGRVALDVGAAAGGFTRVLLDAGATMVYAVDAGHGQLLGSLRQDRRVVNLEATNIADLTTELVPDPIDLVTIDVSYLSLSDAVAQVDRIELAPDADLIGLVKPMFELRLARAPSDDESLRRALERAVAGVESAGWRVLHTLPSAVAGAKGAPEHFLWARRT